MVVEVTLEDNAGGRIGVLDDVKHERRAVLHHQRVPCGGEYVDQYTVLIKGAHCGYAAKRLERIHMTIPRRSSPEEHV